jgi:hypothetical protein
VKQRPRFTSEQKRALATEYAYASDCRSVKAFCKTRGYPLHQTLMSVNAFAGLIRRLRRGAVIQRPVFCDTPERLPRVRRTPEPVAARIECVECGAVCETFNGDCRHCGARGSARRLLSKGA